jgi:hypothetical protein
VKLQDRPDMPDERRWFIRNIAEVPWKEFPNHFGGALSKPLVMPGNAGARHIDYHFDVPADGVRREARP